MEALDSASQLLGVSSNKGGTFLPSNSVPSAADGLSGSGVDETSVTQPAAPRSKEKREVRMVATERPSPCERPRKEGRQKVEVVSTSERAGWGESHETLSRATRPARGRHGRPRMGGREFQIDDTRKERSISRSMRGGN